jgi:peptidoglycan hydrolase CwlO-like protein
MLPSGFRPRRSFCGRLIGPVALVVAALLTSVMLTSFPAQAQSSDPRAERDRVRSQKAEVASHVDALQASDREVEQALVDLDQNVRGQQAAHSDAERAAREAEEEAANAREAADQKQREIDVLREQVSRLAVDSYVSPPGEDVLGSLSAESAGEAVQKQTMLELRTGRDRDLLDELRGAQRELDQYRQQAEAASETASAKRDEASAKLTQVQSARAQQAQFAADVQSRLDAKLGEAAALADTDSRLSQQIASEEAALAERLRQFAAAQARAPTPPPAPRGGTGGSSGGGGGGGGPPTPVAGPIPLANVRGIVVHTSIASQLEGLLAAASASGIVLGGSGYRDINRQIELRRQNCGSSHYAIYEMSPDQCRPPTARPGASKHEQGLAVDFTYNGSTISSRSSPAFQWMAANAGRFGFINLPSEPWHWSVGGG